MWSLKIKRKPETNGLCFKKENTMSDRTYSCLGLLKGAVIFRKRHKVTPLLTADSFVDCIPAATGIYCK